MNAEHADFMADVIVETGAYNDEIVAEMRSSIDAFKATQDLQSSRIASRTQRLGNQDGGRQGNQEQDRQRRVDAEDHQSAMQMVAASKMRRTQDLMRDGQALTPRRSGGVIGHLANSNPEYRHSFMVGTRDRFKRIGYIVVSSDKGLCGGLNVNLFRVLVKDIGRVACKEHRDRTSGLIGNKADRASFAAVGGNVVSARSMSDVGEQPGAGNDLIGGIKVMLDAYDRRARSTVCYIVSNEFVNTMTQKPRRFVSCCRWIAEPTADDYKSPLGLHLRAGSAAC